MRQRRTQKKSERETGREQKCKDRTDTERGSSGSGKIERGTLPQLVYCEEDKKSPQSPKIPQHGVILINKKR